MTNAETEEHARLEEVKAALRHAQNQLDARLDHYDSEIKQQKEHMWDARRDMDHIEKITARQSIEQSGNAAELALAERRRLHKLLRSPYFGRVDSTFKMTELALYHVLGKLPQPKLVRSFY